MTATHDACLAQIVRDDLFERRAVDLLQWVDTCVARLVAPRRGAASVKETASMLAASRVLLGSELACLSAASRGCCRELGDPEAVLLPVLQVVSEGFREARGHAKEAGRRLAELDTHVARAEARLHAVTKSQMAALKAEVHTATSARPASCREVLEICSTVLQPEQKAQDDFAMERLVSDLRLPERVAAFRPEHMSGPLQRKFLRLASQHREVVAGTRARSDAAGPLAQWIETAQIILEEHKVVGGLFRAKEALLAHVRPLARWALRPHKRPILGRAAPPPPPPEFHEAPVPRATAAAASGAPAARAQVPAPVPPPAATRPRSTSGGHGRRPTVGARRPASAGARPKTPNPAVHPRGRPTRRPPTPSRLRKEAPAETGTPRPPADSASIDGVEEAAAAGVPDASTAPQRLEAGSLAVAAGGSPALLERWLQTYAPAVRRGGRQQYAVAGGRPGGATSGVGSSAVAALAAVKAQKKALSTCSTASTDGDNDPGSAPGLPGPAGGKAHDGRFHEDAEGFEGGDPGGEGFGRDDLDDEASLLLELSSDEESDPSPAQVAGGQQHRR